MTTLLEKAFEEAAKLTPAEQDSLARRLLAEFGEDQFDRAIVGSAHRLAGMASDVLNDDVQDLDPEAL